MNKHTQIYPPTQNFILIYKILISNISPTLRYWLQYRRFMHTCDYSILLPSSVPAGNYYRIWLITNINKENKGVWLHRLFPFAAATNSDCKQTQQGLAIFWCHCNCSQLWQQTKHARGEKRQHAMWSTAPASRSVDMHSNAEPSPHGAMS